MKKPAYLVCYSFLSSIIVASCSSNISVTSDLNKVDSVKVSQVTKNPTQDNSVKINLKLMSNQPKFGIKATSDAWVSNSVSRVLVRLHKSGTNPGRFDNPATFANAAPISEKSINVTPTFGGSGFDVPGSIVFNNLKPGNYYVSARAYSNSFNNNAGNLNAGSTGKTIINGTGTAWNTIGSRNHLFKGDIVTVNGSKYTILSVTSDTTFTIALPGLMESIEGSGAPYTIESNVTGEGTLGGGMASNGLAMGGGTASGVATNSVDEESINVSASGVLTFTNPGEFGSSTPSRAGLPNTNLDVAIQIMKEYGASADGAVKLFEGATSDPESIS